MTDVRPLRRLLHVTERLPEDTRVFAMLRELTMIGGVAALLMVPLRPEHKAHLAPFLAGFLAYKTVFVAVLLRWAEWAREILLATLAADLALVFVLVWFTGGGESHFYLLFYLLVALNAHYFGPGIGMLSAVLASALLAGANWLEPTSAPWSHIGSRAALLGLLGLALGHVAAQERAARSRAEQLNEEIEAATARLVRAERLAAVGRLSAKMAHEVRNPLGAITLNVDMLGDLIRDSPGPAMGEAQELLQRIREELRGLATLTDEYLVAARLPRPKLEEDSFNDLVTELVDFVRPVADRLGIRLTAELDRDLPLLFVDRAMLKQALHNLVKNALEATPRGGSLWVRTTCDGGAAVLSVSDTGPGIPPEAAARLFEPFFTTKPRGTGLGLSIAKQVAHEHGGELLWNGPPGSGATFSIRLPLKGVIDG